mmetsp:Transcript_26516/g.74282  ORF Transcript_26516/g.74282 Transcript_26516/m.74282 type:complete len:81 (-) Transcript_26516:445-687(-)|eukprot:scaffold25950_cov27-Tisochrysis_lutea.AAC.2
MGESSFLDGTRPSQSLAVCVSLAACTCFEHHHAKPLARRCTKACTASSPTATLRRSSSLTRGACIQLDSLVRRVNLVHLV